MKFERVERENILIIDDVSSNLVSLAAIAKAAGYIGRPVSSVEHAIRAIDAELPNLILLDITMPKMNGYEYCKVLSEDVRTRDIPVIFISGLNSSKDRVHGFECGAVDFITKPFEKNEVIMRINTHMKAHRMQLELSENNRKLNSLVNAQIRQIEEERRNMIIALANLSEDRYDSTGMHLINISKNCRLIATGLSLTRKYEKVISNDFINEIEVASRLHDVGKMAIPDSILLKKGKLNDKERETMMEHTTIGVNLLQEIYSNNSKNAFIKMAMDIAYSHHEKWDGTGYPRALKGTAIPLAARIMSVVDTYDALVSTRCYKPAYTPEAAVAIISSLSGTSFDPDVVNIFCRLSKRLVRSTRDEEVSSASKIPMHQASDQRR